MADDINQKINIDTKANTTGLKKIEAELAQLQNRLKTLGKNGATAGLERELAKSAKTAERLTNQFKPTKTLVEQINKEMRGLVDKGELTGAKIGVMTREIKRFGQQFKKTVELSSDDRDAWGEKILRMKAAVKAVREMGTAQQKVLEKIRLKEAEHEDAKARAAKQAVSYAKKSEIEIQRLKLRGDTLEHERNKEARVADTKHNRYLTRIQVERTQEQRRQQRWDKIDFDTDISRIKQRNREREQGQRQFARMTERMKRDGDRRRVEVGTGLNAFSMDVPSSFKSRMQFSTRMGRQALAEEKARIREVERYRAQIRRDFEQGLYRAQENGARALHYARMPAYAALGVGAMGAAAVTRGMSGRMAMDTAETNFRIFGAEPASRKGPGSTVTQDDVRRERGWLDKEALTNGITPKAALEAYTEMLKTGITGDRGREFTQLILGAGAGMDMPTDEITKVMGKIAQNVPDIDKGRMKNILNSMAISSAMTSADPNQVVAGMKRGMGVFAQSNMTPEQLAAFSAVGAGAGVQEGKTGNFIAELVSTVGRAGKERGMRRKDLDQAARDLGFGNARGLSRAGRADMSGTITKMLENFNRLDPTKKSITAVRISMREWDDELLQFVNSIDKLKDTLSAITDARNAGFLDRAQEERIKSWQVRWNRIKATFGLFWESFGAGFDETFKSISDYFTSVGKNFKFETITKHVEAFLSGIREGLFGNKTWEQGLASLFGQPGQGSGNWMKELTGFGKGFATGLREVGSAIKSFLTFFAGSNDPEAIGRFTAKLIGLSAALVALSPVISVLGLLASGILALTSALRLSGAALKLLGLGGGAATAATAAPGAAAAGGGFFAGIAKMLGFGALAGGAASLTMGPSKADQDDMMLRLGEYARKRNIQGAPTPAPIDSDRAIQKLREETEARQKLIDELKRNGKQSTNESGFGGLRHFASADSDMRDLKQMFGLQGARFQLAALGSSSLGFGSSGGGGGGSGGFSGGGSGSLPGVLSSRPGSALPPSTFGRRGILGGGRVSGGAGGSNHAGLSGEARERAMQYYAGLRQGGLSAVQANALMGHATQETGGSFSGSSWNAKEGAGGMLQYRGNRLANLQKFAASIGKDWRDPHTQGLFASKERDMDPYERKRSAGFFGATDLATATREAGRNVVRFGDNTGPYRERMARAFADGSAYEGLQGGGNGALTGKPTSQFNLMKGQYGAPGQNLVKVMTPGGKAAWVHKEAAPSFQRFVNELEGSGYKINSFGGHAHRNIRGGSSLSQHAYGNAIDINPSKNPLTNGPLITDMPSNVREMAAKYGLSWGGDFKRRKDAMHFEWTGKRPWEEQAQTIAEKSKAPPTAEALAKAAPDPAIRRSGDGMMGRGGGGTSIHAPISIQGGNSDPESLAQLVQKRLQETQRTRQHDLDYQSI